jgi:hypothetical protein
MPRSTFQRGFQVSQRLRKIIGSVCTVTVTTKTRWWPLFIYTTVGCQRVRSDNPLKNIVDPFSKNVDHIKTFFHASQMVPCYLHRALLLDQSLLWDLLKNSTTGYDSGRIVWLTIKMAQYSGKTRWVLFSLIILLPLFTLIDSLNAEMFRGAFRLHNSLIK